MGPKGGAANFCLRKSRMPIGRIGILFIYIWGFFQFTNYVVIYSMLTDLAVRPGCVAIVTGGASGIGLSVTESLVYKGIRVIIGRSLFCSGHESPMGMNRRKFTPLSKNVFKLIHKADKHLLDFSFLIQGTPSTNWTLEGVKIVPCDFNFCSITC